MSMEAHFPNACRGNWHTESAGIKNKKQEKLMAEQKVLGFY